MNNKKYKILFGVFLALSLLSRYTALWIMPVFLFYFLLRYKSFKFLKDKNLWYSFLVFIVILIPWLLYGFFEYGNAFGAFIHGFKASAYWGGTAPWHFFFDYWLQMFSLIGFIFVAALGYLFYKKDILKKEIYYLLLWFFFFLLTAIFIPHKEDRFILPIVPAIALISGYLVDKIRRYKRLILIGIFIIGLFSLSYQFYITYQDYYTDTNKCFLESNKFLENINKNSVIITDESPIVYYHTKLETRFYPNPLNYETLKNWIKNSYPNKEIYVLFGSYLIKSDEEYKKIEDNLNNNSEKVFICQEGNAFSYVYKIKND